MSDVHNIHGRGDGSPIDRLGDERLGAPARTNGMRSTPQVGSITNPLPAIFISPSLGFGVSI